MHSKISTRWAAYAATLTAIGGSAASASIVHQSINIILTDPDLAAANTAATVCAVRFDGTSITANSTTGGTGAVTITAIDSNTSNSLAKTLIAGTISGSAGYTITPELLLKNATIDAFLQPGSTNYLPTGANTDAYVGVITADKQYGWIHFSYADSGKTITIIDAAFESVPNTPLTIGAGGATASNKPARSTSTAGLTGLAGGLTMLRRQRTGNSGEA